MEILTSVQRYEKFAASGKPYTSLVIKTQSYGDKSLSGFGNAQNAMWKPGDEVDITVEQKGAYLNFSMPKGAPRGAGVTDDHSKARLEQIYQEVYATRQSVVMLVQLLKEKGVIPSSSSSIGIDYPDEIDPENIPF